MNSKLTTYVLAILFISASIFAVYSHTKVSALESDMKVLKSKYEEAIVDAEKAAQRIELMREDLEKALAEAEKHRMEAEAALSELQKKKK
jgi:uncharacterized protein (DUF3084 family)